MARGAEVVACVSQETPSIVRNHGKLGRARRDNPCPLPLPRAARETMVLPTPAFKSFGLQNYKNTFLLFLAS